MTHASPLQGKDALVVGNPTMPRNLTTPTGEAIQLSQLQGAEQEAIAIAKLFNTGSLALKVINFIYS